MTKFVQNFRALSRKRNRKSHLLLTYWFECPLNLFCDGSIKPISFSNATSPKVPRVVKVYKPFVYKPRVIAPIYNGTRIQMRSKGQAAFMYLDMANVSQTAPWVGFWWWNNVGGYNKMYQSSEMSLFSEYPVPLSRIPIGHARNESTLIKLTWQNARLFEFITTFFGECIKPEPLLSFINGLSRLNEHSFFPDLPGGVKLFCYTVAEHYLNAVVDPNYGFSPGIKSSVIKRYPYLIPSTGIWIWLPLFKPYFTLHFQYKGHKAPVFRHYEDHDVSDGSILRVYDYDNSPTNWHWDHSTNTLVSNGEPVPNDFVEFDASLDAIIPYNPDGNDKEVWYEFADKASSYYDKAYPPYYNSRHDRNYKPLIAEATKLSSSLFNKYTNTSADSTLSPISDSDLFDPFSEYTSDPITDNYLIKLFNKTSNRRLSTEFFASTALAESDKALEMLTSRFSQLFRLIRAIRNFQPGNWDDIYLCLTEIAMNKSTSFINRKHLNSFVGENKGSLFFGTLSSLFLEIRYGWEPLFDDISELIKTYLSGHGSFTLTDGAPLKATSKIQVAKHYDSSSTGHSATIYRNTICRMTLFYVDSSVSTFQRLGFGDFKSLIWERIPYSFVLDWFLPVQPYLQAVEYSRNFPIHSVWLSRKDFIHYKSNEPESEFEFTAKAFSRTSPDFILDDQLGPDAHVIVKRGVERTSFSVPLPNFVNPSEALTTKRLQNLSALVIQLSLKFL